MRSITTVSLNNIEIQRRFELKSVFMGRSIDEKGGKLVGLTKDSLV